MSRNRQRKRLFIDWPVQGMLAKRFFVHWFSVAVALFIMTFLLQLLDDPFLPLEDQMRAVWANQGRTLVLLLLLTPAFAWDTIKMSHRFAGPIVRLRAGLKGLAEGGEFTPMRFRDKDCWQELADHFNAVGERIGRAEARAQDVARESEAVGASSEA